MVVRQQKTIENSVSYKGTGLHTGKSVSIVFRAAPPNTGVVFRRVDLDPVVEIPATVENIYSGKNIRNTTITRNGHQIHTVEHLLATVNGLQIDNLIIELDADEPPEPPDGSCKELVEILDEAGYRNQGVPVKPFKISRPVSMKKDAVELIALPGKGFRISFTIEYENNCIGTQYASFDINPDIFRSEIAPSRTFALMSDVEMLKEQGLIKGASLENAIVVDNDRILNENSLRFEDEFVRHKILDLIGDLRFLGSQIEGHIIAVRAGHDYNLDFTKKLAKEQRNRIGAGELKQYWDINVIKEIMPHRYPFLLVDRILELEDQKRVVGIKNVTINEPFFSGHFPGHPIMPAVLIIEAMAQVGGILLLSSVDNPQKYLVYFTGIDKARFKKPVVPGDQVRFELEMVFLRRGFCKMKGRAFVGEKLVAEAVLSSTIVER
jgi:UDP-3-O-[3-hydroxymyristoyl] N-acetylglucosamine deacetylase/3-hydroxyacyl-[acyl-carrier-protein] dehydratase